jgi:hypothetical protein
LFNLICYFQNGKSTSWGISKSYQPVDWDADATMRRCDSWDAVTGFPGENPRSSFINTTMWGPLDS